MATQIWYIYYAKGRREETWGIDNFKVDFIWEKGEGKKLQGRFYLVYLMMYLWRE